MEIHLAEFVCSNTQLSKLPAPTMPEYAFIGRSNVGKSSLINLLTNHKGLAKTSQNPGKTRLINHFLIDNAWYLVDLPGYGYARASKDMRSSWEKMIKGYFQKRENLSCVFLLLDSRLDPQANDLEMIEWIASQGLPLVFVATKADKVKANQYAQFEAKYLKVLQENWETLPEIIKTSATDKVGKDELLKIISEANAVYKAQINE